MIHVSKDHSGHLSKSYFIPVLEATRRTGLLVLYSAPRGFPQVFMFFFLIKKEKRRKILSDLCFLSSLL